MESKLNIVFQDYEVKLQDRISKFGYFPKLIWFTGYSGSGKSTLANYVQNKLFIENYHTYILDGDNVRGGLNKDLDFSLNGRTENIRRIAEVSKLFLDAGTVVLTAFISPLKFDRQQAKSIVGSSNFIEVFVDCPLEICEQRDVKGLYAKARKGLIKDFTGISSPFEAPESPDIHVQTHLKSIEDCGQMIIEKIKQKLKKGNEEL